MTAMLSAIDIASSWSCVTSSGRDVDLVVQAAQPLAQLGADLGVERAERLVEQQHPRLDRERAGERHALALAAGELGRVALGEAGEPDDPQQLVDARLDLVLGLLADRQAEADVVAHRHVLERRVVLEDEADLALLRRDVGDVLAADHDVAGVGVLEAADDPQQRRLARAARPEQRGQRAVRDLQRHVVEGGEVAEPLRHAVDGDHSASRFRFSTVMRSRATSARPIRTVAAA